MLVTRKDLTISIAVYVNRSNAFSWRSSRTTSLKQYRVIYLLELILYINTYFKGIRDMLTLLLGIIL
jgi:hypothetical protein